jgi:hypothetical protein
VLKDLNDSEETMAEIKIDDETTKAILRSALEAHLTPERKDEFIKGALDNLLKSTWQSGSELQKAMNAAASDVARDICREEFDKPETRARVREYWALAWEKVAASEETRETLVDKMASALAEAISGTRSRY